MSERRHRAIRSFVLRQGRLTRGQARALELHWHRYGIEFTREKLDLDGIFGRTAPRVLEIGSGMGEVISSLAQRHPENDYLAVEVHRPGVGSLVRLATERGLQNVRVIQKDVTEILRYQLPAQSLDEVYLLFPDPWPKKRHHKRRLINHEFLDLLLPAMKSHGRLFFLTDRQDLAEDVLSVCDHHQGLVNLAAKGCFSPRPGWLPVTKFENRGRKLGHGLWCLVYCVKRIS